MPHLDPHERIERAYAAEQARKAIAASRAENAARIREQVEPDPPIERGCKRCGDPSAPTVDGICDLCAKDGWLDDVKDKLSPEEIYPEHFPEREEIDE